MLAASLEVSFFAPILCGNTSMLPQAGNVLLVAKVRHGNVFMLAAGSQVSFFAPNIMRQYFDVAASRNNKQSMMVASVLRGSVFMLDASMQLSFFAPVLCGSV